MTLTQLEAFVASVRAGTFTLAAAHLRMSQAAVSDLVRRLEDELGTPLFVRGPRRLSLTSAGHNLLPHADRALESAHSGLEAVRSLQRLEGGTATFGLLRNADLYLRDGLARRFHHRHPNVRVRLVGQNSAETAQDVSAGRLEAGLVTLPVAGEVGLDVLPLVRDEILYVSLEAANVSSRPTIDDLCDRKMVLFDAHFATLDPMRRQLSERAQLAGRRLAPVIEVEYLPSALDLVAAGIGDTLVPSGAVAAEVVPRGLITSPLAEPLFDTVALIRRHGHVLSPPSAEFARLAHEALLENSRLPGSTVELVHEPEAIGAFLA